MSTAKFLQVLFSVISFIHIFLINDTHAQSEARARYEMLKLIQEEKFDFVLPGAMRDNNIDMWIHVTGEGHEDILARDLGTHPRWTVIDTVNYYIFTDRGGDRIERAVLGGGGDPRLYDIFGREKDLYDFVAERDPRRIAIEYSDWLPASNSISYSSYNKLVKALGEKYSSRIVSAEYLITDFRVRRVQAEILAYAKMAELQRQIQEEAYRRIVPEVTTREDLGWWVQDQLMKLGLFIPTRGPSAPGASHSEVPREQRGEVYHRGDFLSWDWGIKYLNFGTDYKRNGYILKEGEYDVPAGLKKAWERGLQARNVIRKTVKVGYTGLEMRSMLVKALEDLDFIYTPFTDIGAQDRVMVNAIGDRDESGFSLDMHPLGNTGRSEFAVGASIAPFRPFRGQFEIQENHFISFEFMVHTWVPEWNRVISINFEDNSIVTNKGLEALYPRNDRIILIH